MWALQCIQNLDRTMEAVRVLAGRSGQGLQASVPSSCMSCNASPASLTIWKACTEVQHDLATRQVGIVAVKQLRSCPSACLGLPVSAGNLQPAAQLWHAWPWPDTSPLPFSAETQQRALLSAASNLALRSAMQMPCGLRPAHPARLSPVHRAGTPQPASDSAEASCLAVARDLQREARQWRDTQFSDWTARTLDSLGSIKVDQSGKLMNMDSRDGRIRLHYNENLVTLLRQVSNEMLSGHLSSIRSTRAGHRQAADFHWFGPERGTDGQGCPQWSAAGCITATTQRHRCARWRLGQTQRGTLRLWVSSGEARDLSRLTEVCPGRPQTRAAAEVSLLSASGCTEKTVLVSDVRSFKGEEPLGCCGQADGAASNCCARLVWGRCRGSAPSRPGRTGQEGKFVVLFTLAAHPGAGGTAMCAEGEPMGFNYCW